MKKAPPTSGVVQDEVCCSEEKGLLWSARTQDTGERAAAGTLSVLSSLFESRDNGRAIVKSNFRFSSPLRDTQGSIMAQCPAAVTFSLCTWVTMENIY